jgi:NTP pyrophosphatase (non-canonical NTP hydrolase)
MCGRVGMGLFDRRMDITRNIRIIEWFKSELLGNVASLYRLLVDGMKEEIHDELADILSCIILISYLLGRKLGINYGAVEIKMRNKIRLGLLEACGTDKDREDLGELSRHLDSSRSGDENE